MGVLREDHHTSTLEDAGHYERARDGGWADWDDNRPSPADLADDAMLDRWSEERQQRRDDAARARGEYVPTSGMRIIVSTTALVLAQHGIYNVSITPTREGVMALGSREPLEAVAVDAALNDHQPGRFEVMDREGTIWVRVATNLLGFPFTDGDHDDEPPF